MERPTSARQTEHAQLMKTYTDKFVTDLSHLKRALEEHGVAILPNVLSAQECANMISGAWNFIENATSQWPSPINRADNKTWRQFSELYPLHSMLIQHHGIGQAQFLWDIRQNPAVIKVFETLWETNQLLVSFDGASVHFPPEVTNKGKFNDMWLHCDQSFKRNTFECVQTWVTAVDVNEGDATLAVLPKSHLHHSAFADKFDKRGGKNEEWHRLNTAEQAFYENLVGPAVRIKCDAGSMVL